MSTLPTMPTAIRFSFFLLFIFIIVRTVAALSWKNSDALPQFASFQPRHVRQIPCTLFVSPSADAAVISILFILFFFRWPMGALWCSLQATIYVFDKNLVCTLTTGCNITFIVVSFPHSHFHHSCDVDGLQALCIYCNYRGQGERQAMLIGRQRARGHTKSGRQWEKKLTAKKERYRVRVCAKSSSLRKQKSHENVMINSTTMRPLDRWRQSRLPIDD